ncbi:CKLF-like MARVEL transmembrane domain-containing protein 2 [Sciurus carolinensis]|uniref:CKLF-like MARVEL transmembrane domain-containing protein 2 n=1 Tax=Sciurus carolinensis TaxID=30640 RepID=A0AA41NIK4_SCICA|nr:CKLF-like MARVEL transmembrane domain-containing protein 2 [Sciurus carolinensis]MBZ3891022.1 CKLF-like MARVEL transmembrane domain-containing protein 2 [Sciurus carolinensis]
MAPKKEEPKDQVGTRTGLRRYKWEFKSSNKEFWLMGHAEVKLISVGCLFGAMAYFNATPVHPALTLLITMELFIFFFFFLINTLAIQRYLSFIMWPVSDLINDLCCFGFLVGGIVFAVNSREIMPLEYIIALGLMGVAAFFAIVDICLQRKHFSKKGPPIVPPEPKK